MTDVWDWETRVLHWLNAILIITLMLLIIGKEGMEIIGVEKALRAPVKRLHAYVGSAFAVTFSLRVIWGFLGNAYSRWPDIIPYKKERWRAIGTNIRWYLSGFEGSPARVTGHDPLASLFYIALFLVLVSQTLTGLTLAGIEFKMFPGRLFVGGMSKNAADALEGTIGEVHELGILFIAFFIIAHLTGLVIHELKEKNGLFSSMIHGKKYFPGE